MKRQGRGEERHAACSALLQSHGGVIAAPPCEPRLPCAGHVNALRVDARAARLQRAARAGRACWPAAHDQRRSEELSQERRETLVSMRLHVDTAYAAAPVCSCN